MLLKNFHLLRPEFESTQEESINWLIDAHVKAERSEDIREEIKLKFAKVGCKPDQIFKRGHVLKDYLHRNWDEMEIYNLNKAACGNSLTTRASVFNREVDKVFDTYYPENVEAPDDLIHVSCTGYVSPSGAQKIVSKRGWGEKTTVTHAYHMGCYGSIPALRMAKGFLLSGKKTVDVVHTEICSLHTNPSLHATDQLVSQSLFADGFIKYTLSENTDEAHIKVLNLKEEIIPNSQDAMTWNVHDWGFEMTLSREVPVFISNALKGFISRLAPGSYDDAIFAVHPGGPKILNYVQKMLNLKDHQLEYSRQILKEHGNISSATLPHIWEKILQDLNIKTNTPIISLAFGPGLSIAGAYMEKRCAI